MPAVYEKIKNDGLHFPPAVTISCELRDLIAGMLEKDPNKRLTLPQIKVIIRHVQMPQMRVVKMLFPIYFFLLGTRMGDEQQ